MLSQRTKEQWQDYEFRERMAQIMQSPEYIEKQRQLSRERWKDPEYVHRVITSLEKRPNCLEDLFVFQLTEAGLYAPDRHEAEPGLIYYPGINGNSWYRTLKDGRNVLPDFKVKSQPKVIELWGSYHHGQEFCEKNEFPDYKWIPERQVEEYEKVGLECKVFMDFEIYDPERSSEIIQEVKVWINQ